MSYDQFTLFRFRSWSLNQLIVLSHGFIEYFPHLVSHVIWYLAVVNVFQCFTINRSVSTKWSVFIYTQHHNTSISSSCCSFIILGLIQKTHTFILSTLYKNARKRGGNGSTSSMLILDTIMGLHMHYLLTSDTASDSNTVFTQRQGRWHHWRQIS